MIPAEARQVIAVLGLSGLNRPIAEAAHCPALYAPALRRCGGGFGHGGPGGGVLRAEGGFDVLVLNQAEGREALGEALAARIDAPVILASLREGRWRLL